MNVPARYCTGYLGDIGVPPEDSPMDFSGWFEAYIGSRWYTFDARHNKPRIGRILMARGRDAADVAIVTTFGPCTLAGFKVITEELTSSAPASFDRQRPPGSGHEQRHLDEPYTGTWAFADGLLETVLVLFFLLLSGNTFLRRLVEILLTFRDKRQAIEISQQIEHDISAYLITITIMNALVGLATACVMWLCGLGDPILWGAAAFLLNYIPFLGPAIGVVMFILLRRADERSRVPARSGRRRRAGPQALVQAVAQRRRLKEPPRPFVPPTTGFIARRRADCGTVSTKNGSVIRSLSSDS